MGWFLGGLVGALALGVVAEIVARWWIRRRDEHYIWRPGSRLHMQTHPEVLAGMEPLVRFEVNSLGERGDEPPAETDGTYRVLVAGGSAAECYFLDQPSTWPEVMKRQLSEPDALRSLGARRVHVGNIGKSLVSTEHVDEVLQRLTRRYGKLDLLVLMTGASNVANWLGRGAPSTIEEQSPIPKGVFEVHPGGPFGWKPGATALAEIWRRFRAMRLRPVEVRERAGERLGKAREMRRRAKTVLDTTPPSDIVIDHFERRLRELLEHARRFAPRVIVVRQPWFQKDKYTAEELAAFWHGAAGNPYVGEVTTYYSVPVVSRLVAQVDARVAKVCDEMGVEQVDLMPLLDPSLRTFYDFWHFRPAGGSVIGRAVAQAVLEPRRTPDATPARRATLDVA